MKEVAPGLFVESAYAPYNLVLIKTDRGGVVVDLPPNPVRAMDWLEQARAILGELRYVVMTDAGQERQFATALCDIPIIATEATLRKMMVYDEERPRREFVEALGARFPEEMGAVEQASGAIRPRPRKPGVAFDEGFTLYAGDRVLQFEAIAGAAEGSLWVLIPEEGILIAGDTVTGTGVPMMADTRDSKEWLNTMTSLARRQDVKMIVPGRGEMWISLGDIEPQREFMRVMRRAARTLARKGQPTLSPSQTAQELGQTFYNSQGNQAVKKIRAGLETLVAEVRRQEEEERAKAQALADERALADEGTSADEGTPADGQAPTAHGPEIDIIS